MSRLRAFFGLTFLSVLLTPLVNCGAAHDADEKYVLVADNLQIPYWQTAVAGFSQSATQLKVHSDVLGPDNFDTKAEQQALQQAIQQHPSGILVSAADPSLLKDDI